MKEENYGSQLKKYCFEELLKFLDKFKTQAKIRRKILKKSYADARRNKFDFGFSEEEVKNIFDIIAQEGENK
mgnify:CR=1 FL=1